jgi:hypothetical protein
VDNPHFFPPRAPPIHCGTVTTTKTSIAHSGTSPTPAGRAQPAQANPHKNKNTITTIGTLNIAGSIEFFSHNATFHLGGVKDDDDIVDNDDDNDVVSTLLDNNIRSL